jgi:mevalonate pyrophosphate decarboxylase
LTREGGPLNACFGAISGLQRNDGFSADAGPSPTIAVRAQSAEAVRKLNKILQTTAQRKIFRDFFASERSESSKGEQPDPLEN